MNFMILKRSIFSILFVAFLLTFLTSDTKAETILVPAGSSWNYLDDGSDQGSVWVDTSFDDFSWAAGPAMLGYGDSQNTVVSFGPDSSNKYTTTYFRHDFNVSDLSGIIALKLKLLRDDGAVVYLNGTEVHRSNMPGTSNYQTFASSTVGGTDEDTFFESFIDLNELLVGPNTLAVEIHQRTLTSSDISFDLELVGTSLVDVTRGPYLQQGSDSQVRIKWTSSVPTNSLVLYGTDLANLNSSVFTPAEVDKHDVLIDSLNADTKYFYAIGYNDTSQDIIMAGADTDHFFTTSPTTGNPKQTRVWIIGDSGTKDQNAQDVKDAFLNFNSGDTDLWLMLGDNAYSDGTDEEYQLAVFDMYQELLINSVLWPTLGNHDGHSADSGTQTGPYYDIFSLPAAGQSGGLASGTEAYYSFDYGNIHFVCLDSYDSDRSKTGVMLSWLENDLLGTNADWVIAFWHHPPYSKGSHDSDSSGTLTAMRENAVDLLEDYGVDLVFSGHSHSYERSFLIDNHLGTSGTLNGSMILDGGDGKPSGDGQYSKPSSGMAPHEGAVFVVAGSSGKTSSLQADAPHPVMIQATLVELGSVIVDVDGNTLNAQFLKDNGVVADNFTIVKGTATPTPTPTPTPSPTPTPTPDPFTDHSADSQQIIDGQIFSGSLSSTFTDDDIDEVLRENTNSGKKSNRISSLEKHWSINQTCPSNRLTINAFYDFDEFDNVGTDDFIFQYQESGGGWTNMFIIDPSEITEQQEVVNDVPTPLTIRVIDSNGQVGNNGRDRVAVDYISLRCYNGTPPPTPTPTPVPTATPTPTPPPGGIDLTANGFTAKNGKQRVDLNWTPFGTTTNVDVTRTKISGAGTSTAFTTQNDGQYRDNMNTKGSSVYDYQVCESGTTNCSNTATVVF